MMCQYRILIILVIFGVLFPSSVSISDAEIVACNTDQQHLDVSEADRKFLIGREATRGLGCGGYPSKGTEAAQESIQELKDTLKFFRNGGTARAKTLQKWLTRVSFLWNWNI